MLGILSYLPSFADVQTGCLNGNTCKTGLPQTNLASGEVQQILQIVFAIFAALAVLMIVVAGFRFVTAQGNPQEVAKARGTIIYSVVGLVVALSAEAIVSFLLGQF